MRGSLCPNPCPTGVWYFSLNRDCATVNRADHDSLAVLLKKRDCPAPAQAHNASNGSRRS
jgi:hypothetical protein